MIETTRRSFISGLISLVAAPAIVRVQNIMPVKVIKPTLIDPRGWHSLVTLGQLGYGRIENGALIKATAEQIEQIDLALRNTFTIHPRPEWLEPLYPIVRKPGFWFNDMAGKKT